MSGKKRNRTRSARRPNQAAPRQLAVGGLLILFFLAAALPVSADTFTYSGDSATTILAEGSQHALLTGHAQVNTQDLRITADRIELFGKDFTFAQCQGGVRVVDTKRGLDLSSKELFYDRDRKIARIKGNAVMADLKNEMVVKGGFIEDRDTEKITIVQIGVRIFKKDITCKAEFAKYWRDKKILELSGMPWVSKGTDVYQAARITINLDTEDITLQGDVQGTIRTESKEGAVSGADRTSVPPAVDSGKTPPATAAPPAAPGGPGQTAPAPPGSPSGNPGTAPVQGAAGASGG
jgi:lipopolysaccharide export system protein LptA